MHPKLRKKPCAHILYIVKNLEVYSLTAYESYIYMQYVYKNTGNSLSHGVLWCFIISNLLPQESKTKPSNQPNHFTQPMQPTSTISTSKAQKNKLPKKVKGTRRRLFRCFGRRNPGNTMVLLVPLMLDWRIFMLCDFFRKKNALTPKKKRKSESPTNVIMFWNPFWSPGLEFLFLTLEAWIWFPQAKVHHETYPPSNKQLPSNSKLCIQNENFPSHHSQSAGSPEFYTTSTINLIGHLQPLHLPHVLRLCLQQFRWGNSQTSPSGQGTSSNAKKKMDTES